MLCGGRLLAFSWVELPPSGYLPWSGLCDLGFCPLLLLVLFISLPCMSRITAAMYMSSLVSVMVSVLYSHLLGDFKRILCLLAFAKGHTGAKYPGYLYSLFSILADLVLKLSGLSWYSFSDGMMMMYPP